MGPLTTRQAIKARYHDSVYHGLTMEAIAQIDVITFKRSHDGITGTP